MKAIEAAAKTLREKLFNAIWRCGFAPDEDPAVIEAKKAEWPDDVRAAYRRADACLSVIAALAEDDAAVERVAEALVRSDRNYVMYHMPGDRPRKWRTPGGAIWDTNPLSVETAQRVRIKARAAIRAMGGE